MRRTKRWWRSLRCRARLRAKGSITAAEGTRGRAGRPPCRSGGRSPLPGGSSRRRKPGRRRPATRGPAPAGARTRRAAAGGRGVDEGPAGVEEAQGEGLPAGEGHREVDGGRSPAGRVREGGEGGADLGRGQVQAAGPGGVDAAPAVEGVGPGGAEIGGRGAQGVGHLARAPAGVLLQQQGADAGGDGRREGGAGDVGVLAQGEGLGALAGAPAGDGEHAPPRGHDVGLDAAVGGGAPGAGGGQLPRPGVDRADGDDPGAVGGHADVVPVGAPLVAGGGDDDDAPGHGQLGGARGQGGGAVEVLVVVAGAVLEAGVAEGGVDDLGAEAVGPLDAGHPAVLLDGQLALAARGRGGHVLGLGQQVLRLRRHPDQVAGIAAGDDAEDAGAVHVLAVVRLLPADRLVGLVADVVVAVEEVPGGHDPQVGEGGVGGPVEAGVDEGDADALAEEAPARGGRAR